MAKKPTKQSLEQALLDQIAALSAQVAEMKAMQSQQQVVQQTAKKKSAKGQPRPDVYYVLLGIPADKMPPQAIACARILAGAVDTNHISESEAMELMEAGKESGRLRTDQPAWRIFQYYRARLISADYLQMRP